MTRPPTVPRPEESAYFYTVDYGFHISVREATVRYSLTLEPRSAVDRPLHLVVRYENPSDPDRPLVEEELAEPGEYLFLQSPPLSGLEAGRVYRVEVLIFDDQANEAPADLHTVYVQSILTTHQ